MLQVIREYATERLFASGEADQLCRPHAILHLDLVVEAALRLRHGGMRSVVEKHIANHANIREAMRWFVDTGDGSSAAAMGFTTWPLWFTLGRHTEGVETMERVLGGHPA